MKITNRLIAVVVAVLIAAALVFGVRSCASDDTNGSKPKATATATTVKPKIPSTSTGYIIAKIKGRLETITGRPVKLDCPKRIDLVKGTKMTCKVFYTKDPKTQVAEAVVTMKDRTGVFTWKSNPV